MAAINNPIIEQNIRLKGSEVDACLLRRIFFAAGSSDCGIVRRNNEDKFLISGGSNRPDPQVLICAVADGMGGHDHGEVASLLAVKILEKKFAHLNASSCEKLDYMEWLEKTIQSINGAIRKRSYDLEPNNLIGTTLVTTMFVGQKAYVANVGDSRAYVVRQGCLKQITRDHSLVSLMVEKGLIEPEEIYTHPRRGEIVRFLGQDGEPEVDFFELDISIGDTIMLCSDGLWEMVRDNEIYSILQNNYNPGEACASLIRCANQAGGTDNITAIVVKIEECL